MADYTQETRDAAASFKESGGLFVLSWTPAPTSDAPDAPTPEAVEVRASGLLLEYSAKSQGTQADSLILAGDKQVLLAALDDIGNPISAVPPEAQILAPDGVTYTVKMSKPLAPAGVPIMFDLNVRR
jgi:hypothetical protein